MTRTLRYRLTRRNRLVRQLTRRLGERYVNDYRGPVARAEGRGAAKAAA